MINFSRFDFEFENGYDVLNGNYYFKS